MTEMTQLEIKNPKSTIRPSGFSFAEVMFAVIVLGIGFIMIAAVFPVAITQSKTTKEETTIASVAVQGAQILTQAGQWDAAPWTWWTSVSPTIPQDQPDRAGGTRPWADQAFPHTGYYRNLVPLPVLPTGTWTEESVLVRGQMIPISLRDMNPYVRKVAEMLRSSRINADDRRFGWVAFYRRDVTLSRNFNARANTACWKETPASYAQVVIIGVQSQGEGQPTFNDTVTEPANANSDVYQGNSGTLIAPNYNFTNLDPRPVRVQIVKRVNDVVGKLTVTALQNGDPFYDNTLPGGNATYKSFVNGIAPGCYLVIADDRIAGPTTGAGDAIDQGRLNGRLYRIGEYLGQNSSGEDEYNLSPDGDFDYDAGEDGSFAANNDNIYSLGIADPDSRSNVTFNTPAIGFIVGKPMINRADVSKGVAGGIMDISAYSTFIQVK